MVGTYEAEREFNANYVSIVESAAKAIRARANVWPIRTHFGIILGSGLNDLANSINVQTKIPYKDIEHFPVPTVEGHEGNIIIGDLEGISVIGLQGRIHYYEHADEPFGNGMLRSVLPVHVLAQLGVENMLLTNAVGGLALKDGPDGKVSKYQVSDTVVITSHLSELPDPTLCPYRKFLTISGEPVMPFTPLNGMYDKDLRALLIQAAPDATRMHEGVYQAVPGRSYETEAEARKYRNDGADTVGMSIAHEAIVARNRGMKVVAMSCITNLIPESGVNNTNHDEVKAVLDAPLTRSRLAATIENFFRAYSKA